MSSIEWTDETWNPVVGCSRVSKGCEHCYAEGVAHRGMSPQHRGLTVLGKQGIRWNGKVRLVEGALAKPLRWRDATKRLGRPLRIFVNSMSDLFHEALSNEDIARVFAIMAGSPWHTFQVLTKRPDRARAWFKWIETAPAWGSDDRNDPIAVLTSAISEESAPLPAWVGEEGEAIFRIMGEADWPLPNVWLGVSVEDQATADERIPVLLETPATVRFVSYEPALGPVDLGLSSATCACCPRWPSRWVRLPVGAVSEVPFGVRPKDHASVGAGVYRAESNKHGALSVRTSEGGALGIKPDEFVALPRLDWVIVGGESGARARPFDLAWARSTIAACKKAGVACFVKQLGRVPHTSEPGAGRAGSTLVTLYAGKNRKGSDMAEWPEDLRVREFPR